MDAAANTGTSTPAWPAGCTPHRVDTGEHTAELHVRSTNLVQFDDDVAGWTIRLLNRTNRTVPTVIAPAVDDLVLELAGRWPAGVEIDAPGATIRLDPANQEVHVRLVSDVAEVQVGSGTIRIDGDVDYVLRSQHDGRSRRGTVVVGDAAIRRITGEGEVEVRASFVVGTERKQRRVDDGFTGTLTCKPPLRGVKLSGVDVRLNATEIVDSNIDVRSVIAERISNSRVGAIEYVRGRSASTSTVRVSEGTNAAVLIGRWQQVPGTVDTVIEGGVSIRQTLPGVTGGPVTRCEIATTSGDIIVGELVDSTISAGGTVLADRVEAPAREASYTAISAKHVAIRGDADLADGVGLVSSGDLAVEGKITDGSIRSQATLLAMADVASAEISADTATVRGTLDNARVSAATADVSGDVVSSRCSADVISLQGNARDATLEVGDQLTLADGSEVDANTTVILKGSAELPLGFRANLRWEPAGERRLLVAGPPASLRVIASEPLSTIDVGVGCEAWPELAVDGQILIKVPKGNRNTKWIWQVAVMTMESQHTAVRFEPDNETRIASVSSARGGAIERCGGAAAMLVHVDQSRQLKLHCRAGSIEAIAETDDEVSLSISGGGSVAVRGQIRRLCGRSEGGQAPTLHVPATSVVHELRGEVRLGEIAGRVEVPSSAGRRDKTQPPVVHDIAPQEATTGYVVGVNPTSVEYAALENANRLHVFEPDPRALMRWADERGRKPYQARTAAATAMRISEQVRSSAASGGARSAAAWAAARTHHAAVDRSHLERLLRWFHRLFGYSHRPFPPLMTYLAMVGTWTVLACLLDLVNEDRQVEHPFWRDPGDTASLTGRIAILPVTWLLRVSDTEGAATLFSNLFTGVLAFITVGLPFIFFIVALRNFMAAPDGTKL